MLKVNKIGLFKKRRKTTTETTNYKKTLSKIVKFSYLQTLAIDGGLTTARGIAGETEAKESKTDSKKINTSLQDKVITAGADVLSNIFGDLPSTMAGVARSLFGKKITSETTVDVKESGWTLTKIWNQPQFDIIRYAIGIKELTVAQFTYEQVSEFVSKPWSSPKDIIKVTSIVDQFIPGIFPVGTYIKYYVKPNIEESDWTQINPLGLPSVFNEDGSIVPRIINFNTERPISSGLEESYVLTSKPVREIVFKAVLTRPTQLEGTTASADGYSPILKSYRLLMYPANGLS